MPSDTPIRRFVRWGLYPLSWLWIIGALTVVLQMDMDERPAWMVITGPLLLLFLVLEVTVPLDKRWGMSWRNLPADIGFVVLASAAIGLTEAALALGSIMLSGMIDGPASDWPLWLQLPAIFLGFEFVNYWVHRAMHELSGPVGGTLWRVHAAHHLPEGLYLLMHAVSHPLNVIIIQAGAIVLPIWLMGYTPEAMMIFFVVNAFHGIISHFNVDLRMGVMNYIFVGPELHRYHHSADVDEAKNYGATITLWDQLFGTFVYRPSAYPKALGTAPEAGLPSYRKVLRVLALPFYAGRQVSSERVR